MNGFINKTLSADNDYDLHFTYTKGADGECFHVNSTVDGISIWGPDETRNSLMVLGLCIKYLRIMGVTMEDLLYHDNNTIRVTDYGKNEDHFFITIEEALELTGLTLEEK